MAWRNKGRQKVTHKTVNGDVAVERTIYWNKRHGTVAPADVWLGIAPDHYSAGVREMGCRACLRASFAPASEDLARTAQIRISDSALRDWVKHQGRRAYEDSYAVGTSGDCHDLGRLMRREAAKLKIDQAAQTYSVTDGAPWILRQYQKQLPMVKMNILDSYHLREHVRLASWTLYGEGTAKAGAWQTDLMEQVWERGSLAMLETRGHYLRRNRHGLKAKALRSLRDYVAPRVNMTDYPAYRELGYDCGSGPTESFCGTLTARLKGRGMHWDKDNAESMMALGGLYYSKLWHHYWHHQRTAA